VFGQRGHDAGTLLEELAEVQCRSPSHPPDQAPRPPLVVALGVPGPQNHSLFCPRYGDRQTRNCARAR